jgi:type IV secretory pathway VirB3-like protein
MNDKEKHTVYHSLISQPTFAGLPRGQFFIEVAVWLLVVNIFRMSIITILILLALYFGVHRQLKASYKKDPMLIEFIVMSIIDRHYFFPSASDINYEEKKEKHSIPTNL